MSQQQQQQQRHHVFLALTVSLVLFIVLVILVACLVCMRRRQVQARRRPVKKRVVLVMDANAIYNGRAVVPAKSLVVPSIPRVKIVEGGRRRFSSDITAVTEWELPLDEQWEFPRDK